MSVGSEEFRHALAHWATGVAVLTCRWQTRPYALTVTSFSSVSLDPPLVLVCIGKQSRFHPYVTAAGAWSIIDAMKQKSRSCDLDDHPGVNTGPYKVVWRCKDKKETFDTFKKVFEDACAEAEHPGDAVPTFESGTG